MTGRCKRHVESLQTSTPKVRMLRCNVRLQFDLENSLTTSQLTKKSADERNAATLMVEILKGTEGKIAHVMYQHVWTQNCHKPR